jgi:hypothetical protein
MYLLTGITALALNPMTLTTAPPGSEILLLELLALFLTVATIWFLFVRHRNAPKRDRPPIFLGLNRCDYSVCDADLLRASHHNLQ